MCCPFTAGGAIPRLQLSCSYPAIYNRVLMYTRLGGHDYLMRTHSCKVCIICVPERRHGSLPGVFTVFFGIAWIDRSDCPSECPSGTTGCGIRRQDGTL